MSFFIYLFIWQDNLKLKQNCKYTFMEAELILQISFGQINSCKGLITRMQTHWPVHSFYNLKWWCWDKESQASSRCTFLDYHAAEWMQFSSYLDPAFNCSAASGLYQGMYFTTFLWEKKVIRLFNVLRK